MSSSVAAGSRAGQHQGVEPAWQRWRKQMERRAPVTARVVAAWPGYMELDLGAVPGRIRRKDLVPRPGRLEDMERLVGEEIQGLVVAVEPEGHGVVISPRHLSKLCFGQALTSGRRLSGHVVVANDGGLVVEVEGARGFVPRSQLRRWRRSNHRARVGRAWKGYALTVTGRKFILSERRPKRPKRGRRRRTA